MVTISVVNDIPLKYQRASRTLTGSTTRTNVHNSVHGDGHHTEQGPKLVVWQTHGYSHGSSIRASTRLPALTFCRLFLLPVETLLLYRRTRDGILARADIITRR